MTFEFAPKQTPPRDEARMLLETEKRAALEDLIDAAQRFGKAIAGGGRPHSHPTVYRLKEAAMAYWKQHGS